jgi:hypothetical protein
MGVRIPLPARMNWIIWIMCVAWTVAGTLAVVAEVYRIRSARRFASDVDRLIEEIKRDARRRVERSPS